MDMVQGMVAVSADIFLLLSALYASRHLFKVKQSCFYIIYFVSGLAWTGSGTETSCGLAVV